MNKANISIAKFSWYSCS